MQARNAVLGKIHEALAYGTLHADEAKVLEEMSEMLKESFQVRLTSVLQSEFDGQCAVDDVNVGTVSSSFLQKQDFGNLSTEQMSERGGVRCRLPLTTVSHAKLVDNRVTLQAPEPVFKSAGLQTFKTSCTDVMYFVTIATGLLSPCRSCCNLQHVLPEHRVDRVDVRGGNVRPSGASDGRGSVSS